MTDYLTSWFNDNLSTSTNRIRVQSTTTAQDSVINGGTYTTKWRENSIASGASAYAEFTIPVDTALSLTKRVINTNGSDFKYRAYPQGSYTTLADKVDDGNSFAKTRNNRQDGAVTNGLIRTTVTGTPTLTSAIVFDDIFGSEGSGNRSTGGLESENSFFILTGGQTFLLELRNDGSTTKAASVELEYLLFPESALPIIS